MIITISGKPGSGKTTIAKLLAKRLNLNHYSVGDFMREMADKRRITLMELTELAKKDKTIDKELEQMQIDLGKESEDFVLDSRLGFHFIPHSVRVFLDVDIEEGAKRVFMQKRKDEKENTSLGKTIENMKKRVKSDKLRYKKLYNLNHYNKKHYSLIIDTTNLTRKQVLDKVVAYINNL